MSKFFDKFPKISYNISGTKPANYQLVANIFFRFGFLRSIINNISAYEEYTVTDGDTPEIVASKYYGNPEAYWLVLYANNIYDPQYGWPLSQQNFVKFIETKYGSVANAQSQIHHYEKVIGRQVENSDEYLFQKIEVDYAPVSMSVIEVGSYTGSLDPGEIVYQSEDSTYNNATFTANVINFTGTNNIIFLSNTIGNYSENLYTYNYSKGGYTPSNVSPYGYQTVNILFPDTTIPHDCYVNLPVEPTTETYTFNGKTISEVVGRRAVTCYDYENELNDSKHNIKLINRAYYGKIMIEFDQLTNSIPGYIRKLKG